VVLDGEVEVELVKLASAPASPAGSPKPGAVLLAVGEELYCVSDKGIATLSRRVKFPMPTSTS
jgi:hypothetical protein